MVTAVVLWRFFCTSSMLHCLASENLLCHSQWLYPLKGPEKWAQRCSWTHLRRQSLARSLVHSNKNQAYFKFGLKMLVVVFFLHGGIDIGKYHLLINGPRCRQSCFSIIIGCILIIIFWNFASCTSDHIKANALPVNREVFLHCCVFEPNLRNFDITWFQKRFNNDWVI